MEGEFCQGSKIIDKKSKSVGFYKADSKTHLSEAGGRTPLKFTATEIIISTVKNKT